MHAITQRISLSSLLLAAAACALCLLLILAGAERATPPAAQESAYPTEILPDAALALNGPPTGAFTSAERAAKPPRLDATLAEVALTSRSRWEVSRRLARALAAQGDLRLAGERVQIQLTVAETAEAEVGQAVERLGGAVTGSVGGPAPAARLLQVWLPIDALADIAEHPAVYYLRRPAGLELFAEAVEGIYSEALAEMNVAAWRESGRTGRNVRVGVIDGGFSGYRALLGKELPAQVTVANFVDVESLEAVDGSTRHGAAVAEIVHDIAPDADLLLAKIDTNVDLHEAVDWLIGQKADVLVTSIGWYNLAPGDGTGQFAQLVQRAKEAGILWVTAAGNDRETHWGGLFADPDNDRYHNFALTQEVNFFGPGDGSTYLIPAGLTVNIHVRWDDWLDVRSDYDLYLVRWTGSAWQTVASSSNPQSGQPGQTPTETIRFVTDGPAAPYGFLIYQHSGTPTQPINFEIFAPRFLRPGLTVASRSLPNLADAPDALTVAAVNVYSPYDHQPYSSEGPTNGPGGAATGGQPKPDLAAYANVATASYGILAPFGGTSAAAPHAAGAAALVKQAYPQAGPAQLRAFLEERAVDVGSAGQDAQTGQGRLHLGAPPASLVNSSMAVQSDRVSPGETVTYTIRLVNSGGITATASLRNPIPTGLALAGEPTQDGAGSLSVADGALAWDGIIAPGVTVAIAYPARLLPPVPGAPVRVLNGATITDDEGRRYSLSVSLNPLKLYLPAIDR